MLCHPDRKRCCNLLRKRDCVRGPHPPTLGNTVGTYGGFLRVGGLGGVGREWADVDHRHRRNEVGALVCDVSEHVAVSEEKNMRC